jgi:hypothetical protein
LAAGGGNPNAGDVWTDNVGQPAGPGHEQDPHLACQDINLWGAELADPSGSYTIDGWPPSGSQEQDYASSWTYDQSKGGSQVIDVISVKTLVANAVAHGDAPVNTQGYHFKLQFSQDPQKHKTFWVNCPAASGGTSGGNSGGGGSSGGGGTTSGGGGTTSGGGGTTGSGGATGGGGNSSGTPRGTPPPVVTTGSSAPKGTVRPVHRTRHKKRHTTARRHGLARPKRHHKARHRRVSTVDAAAPEFTG